ncbi:unnamed protein product [Rotaria magnacalcarata]
MKQSRDTIYRAGISIRGGLNNAQRRGTPMDITSTIGQCEENDNESEYTDFDFYPKFLRGISSLSPDSSTFLEVGKLTDIFSVLQQSKSKDIGDLSFEVLPLDQAFSKIIYLAIGALTIPVFSTTTERAFSK